MGLLRLLLRLALGTGVESGEGVERKAESEESEAVEEDEARSFSQLQVSEQYGRPWRDVSCSPSSGLRQKLQQKQEGRACQCWPWWVACSLSAPEGQGHEQLSPSPQEPMHRPAAFPRAAPSATPSHLALSSHTAELSGPFSLLRAPFSISRDPGMYR